MSAGDDALLFGGYEFNGQLVTLNTGAIFESETATWKRMADAPFDPALYSPAAVWVDGVAVVVGVPCRPHSPDGVPECAPGGYAAALYHREDDRWTQISAPAVAPGSADLLPRPQALLANGSDAIFAFAPSSLWSYNVAAQTWRPLAAPPFEAESLCATHGRVVALDYRFGRDGQVADHAYPVPTPGSAVSVPPAAAEAYVDAKLSSYDPALGVWSPASPPAPGLRPRVGFQVVCGASDVLVVAEDRRSMIVGFDAETSRWMPLPPPPIAIQEAPLTSVALGQEILLWNGLDEQGAAFDFRTESWRVFSAGPELVGGAVAAVGGAALIYVAQSPERWGPRPRAFQFVPSRGGEPERPFAAASDDTGGGNGG